MSYSAMSLGLRGPYIQQCPGGPYGCRIPWDLAIRGPYGCHIQQCAWDLGAHTCIFSNVLGAHMDDHIQQCPWDFGAHMDVIFSNVLGT